MAEEKKTGRVSMEWPADLKDQVRGVVGSRGLTDFTVQAVRTRLADRPETQDLNKEVNEVRDLAQRMADTLVRIGDDDDPLSRLVELELPAWIDTTGWPEAFVRAVRIEDPTPEPVTEEQPESNQVASSSPEEQQPGSNQVAPDESDEDLHRPMFMTGDKPPAETPPASAPDLPHDRQSGSLLDRVRQKALEKGVDIDPANLKPASEVPKKDFHEERAEAGLPPAPDANLCPNHPDVAIAEGGFCPKCEPTGVEDPVEAETDARPDSDLCPDCKSELVAGECWECM